MSIQSTFNQGLTLASLLGSRLLEPYAETRRSLKNIGRQEKTVEKALDIVEPDSSKEVELVNKLAELEEKRFDVKPTEENLNRLQNARDWTSTPEEYDTPEKSLTRNLIREGMERSARRQQAAREEQARIAESNRIRNIILGGGSNG